MITSSDLSGANLSSAYLWYLAFTRVNISGADFSNAQLDGAYFQDVNLLGAKNFDPSFDMFNSSICIVTMPDGSYRDEPGCEGSMG
ncbi:MAG: pentapeptide repeat-containing protein [Thermoproteota archaeon]